MMNKELKERLIALEDLILYLYLATRSENLRLDVTVTEAQMRVMEYFANDPFPLYELAMKGSD